MPFSDPLVPSSFTIGLVNAGHAKFDQNGVTFYSTDGVTAIFRYDFATGILTLGPAGASGTAQHLVIDPTDTSPIQMWPGDAAQGPATLSAIPGSNPGDKGLVGLAAPYYGSTQGQLEFNISAQGETFSFNYGNFGSMAFYPNGSGSLARMVLDAGALGGGRYQAARTGDLAMCNVPLCRNVGVNEMDGGTFDGTTDASSGFNIPHTLGAVPNIVSVTINDTSAFQVRVTSLSSTNILARFATAVGGALTIGTVVRVRWAAWG